MWGVVIEVLEVLISVLLEVMFRLVMVEFGVDRYY